MQRLLRFVCAAVVFALFGASFPAGPVRAQAPAPVEPILRLDPGMHTASIRRLAVTADGRVLATGSEDKTVRLWSLPEDRLIRTLRPPIGAGSNGKVYAVAIDPAGRWVATGGWDVGYLSGATGASFVTVFDASTGALLRRLGPLPRPVIALRASPDGRRLVAGLGGLNGIRVWDTDTWAEVFADPAYEGDVYGVDFARDGRLATTSLDGHVRLYGADGRRRAWVKAPGGAWPYGVAFSPDGSRVAVGYAGRPRVSIHDAATLAPLFEANMSGIANGDLLTVAWLDGGARLAAAGQFQERDQRPILIWADGGRGARSAWPGPGDTVTDLLALPGGGVAFGAGGPAFGTVIGGARRLFTSSRQADMREKRGQQFQVSADGRRVRFSLDRLGVTPVLLDVAAASVMPSAVVSAGLQPADTTSLAVAGWENTMAPKLAGKPLALDPQETARSFAVLPGRAGIILGADWLLRRFARDGTQVWQQPVPDAAWGVNITRDGRLVVVACGDGTIRWHRASDGKELLAAFIHVDRSSGKAEAKGVVLWTPKGYYHASAGAEDIIGWHVNNGPDKAADYFPASRFRERFNRPDIVTRILDDLDEDTAINAANAEANRRTRFDDLRAALPPIVEVLAPSDGDRFSDPLLTISFSVRSPSGQPVTAVDVLIDGRPVETARGLDRATFNVSAAGLQSLTIPVPKRDFDLALIARTARSTGEASRRRLVYASATQQTAPVTTAPQSPSPSEALKPKLYALLVGVSDYAKADLKLAYAAKDATDMAVALTRQNGGLYRDVEIRTLTDAQATSDGIRDGFGWLEKEVTARDVAVVFLAGHGVTDLQQRFWYLPVNADPGNLRSTSIPTSDFEDVLRALPGKVLMFIDACHAGRGIERTRLVTRGGNAGADITMLVNELTSTENGVVMFASSTGRELSMEHPDWQNGAFTKAVVEGLAGKADYNKDGAISIKELDLYISERVKELTEKRQHPVARKPDTIPDYPIAVVR